MHQLQPDMIVFLFFLSYVFLCFCFRFFIHKISEKWEERQLNNFVLDDVRTLTTCNGMRKQRNRYEVENIIEVLSQQSRSSSVISNQTIQVEIPRNVSENVTIGFRSSSICDVVIYSRTASKESENLPLSYDKCVEIITNIWKNFEILLRFETTNNNSIINLFKKSTTSH